jgi:hypothetical protein
MAMEFENVLMFDAPQSKSQLTERQLQWRQWRNRSPLRRMLTHDKDRLGSDITHKGGWHETPDCLERGLLLEIPEALAQRMRDFECGIRSKLDANREPLLPTMRAWLTTRPNYPWTDDEGKERE